MPNITRYHFMHRSFNRARFVADVLHMRTLGLYERYVRIHLDNMRFAHWGLSFLAWHRALLWEFERDLQAADRDSGRPGSWPKDGRIGVPYWDWAADNSADPTDARGKLWENTFMGGTGSPVTGPFAPAAWPPPSPPMPAGITGLSRNLGAIGPLSNDADINYALSLTSFDVAPFIETSPNGGAAPDSFRSVLEGQTLPTAVPLGSGPSPATHTGTARLHNRAHGWVGGIMNMVPISVYDPVFWLNHANVDRLWARWQVLHPQLASQWPAEGLLKLAPLTITTAGVGYTNGTYPNVPLATVTGSGTGARANITIAGGAVTAATVVSGGRGYADGNTLRVGPALLGGGTPSITTVMLLTVPANGTDSEIDRAYPTAATRPPRVLKLNEPMLPWDGTGGNRLWTPRSVLNWQRMGPSGEHQYRYSTDSPGSFRFT